MKKLIIGLFCLSALTAMAEVNIYGPGGPAPVFKEIVSNVQNNKNINLQFGPTKKWIESAKENADIIFSGSDFMMNGFSNELSDIDKSSIKAIKIREAGILVKKGNSKNIHSIKDLAKKDINIIVVDGAGQISLWEDMVGKSKDVDLLNKVRTNIKYFAPNSAMALSKWEEDKSIDAVIIWKPWEKRFKESKFISVEEENRIYRPALIALTKKGENNAEAKELYEKILSKQFDNIWEKNNWMK